MAKSKYKTIYASIDVHVENGRKTMNKVKSNNIE